MSMVIQKTGTQPGRDLVLILALVCVRPPVRSPINIAPYEITACSTAGAGVGYIALCPLFETLKTC